MARQAIDHADARVLVRQATNALADRDAKKKIAALLDPSRDAFAENFSRARREGWRDGTLSDQHTPRQ